MVNNIGIRYVTKVMIDFVTPRTPLTNEAPPDGWADKKKKRKKEAKREEKEEKRKMKHINFK